MVNYSQAKIYKIVDNTNNNVYIGSTCEPTLARRLAGHIVNYKQYLKGKSNFVTSFDIFKNGDYDIILIENVKCDSKDQLTARERYYIESLECINKCIPGRTKKEYKQDNKEKIKDYNKTKHICECGVEYSTKNKTRHMKSLTHYNYNYMKAFKQLEIEELELIENTKHQKNILNKMIQEYEILLNMEKNRINCLNKLFTIIR
jgi:hypothetical protein